MPLTFMQFIHTVWIEQIEIKLPCFLKFSASCLVLKKINKIHTFFFVGNICSDATRDATDINELGLVRDILVT